MSGVLGCSTAPLLLGAGETAKGAGLYMCKYMVKDAYELAASLSVLADAREHIDKYKSVADDASTSERESKKYSEF